MRRLGVLVLLCGACSQTPLQVSQAPVSAGLHDERRLVVGLPALWESRHKPDARRQLIEGYLRLSNDHVAFRDGYSRLSRLYFLEGFYGESDESVRMNHFERGMHWAQSMIPVDVQTASLDELRFEDAEALYWYGMNYFEWIRLNGRFTFWSKRQSIERMMNRFCELDPHYMWAACERFWGHYWAVIPWPFRDHSEARSHFDKAQAANIPSFWAHSGLASDFPCQDDEREACEMEWREATQSSPEKGPWYSEELLERQRCERMVSQRDKEEQ